MKERGRKVGGKNGADLNENRKNGEGEFFHTHWGCIFSILADASTLRNLIKKNRDGVKKKSQIFLHKEEENLVKKEVIKF